MDDVKKIAWYIGHRERLRQKFLDDKLTDYELLELLISYAIPRRDVHLLARNLIEHFGGVYQILTAPMDRLIEFDGVGRNTAIFIKVVGQIMLDGYRGGLKEAPLYRNDALLKNYCVLKLGGKTVEELHVLYFDADWRMLSDDLHSNGTFNTTVAYPREILRRALDLNARSVVLVHNHPTIGTAFSSQDIAVTEQISNLLKVVDIGLYDHYVVSGEVVYSAKDSNLLK